MKRNISKRQIRHKRIRSKVSGTSDVPRLSVFKSNRYLTAQIIDDQKAETLVYLSTKEIKEKSVKQVEKVEILGKKIAEMAKAKGLSKVVFDRGGFEYAGKIAKFAESARQGGLIF